MRREKLAAIFLGAVTVLAIAAAAGAVDGTIEINQAKVMANGGFPYAIGTANTSYRLAGSLIAPAGTDAIDVSVANVTIDLNGFSIVGPGSSNAAVTGINASGMGEITVENGTVTGFGTGVQLGSYGIVKNIHADVNGNGIHGGNNSVVEGCTANNSTTTGTSGFGIYCLAACAISNNTANGNPFAGIQCAGTGCAITGNTAIGNVGFGIECLGTGCLISGNTIINNGTGIEAIDASTGYGLNVLSDGTNAKGGTSIGNNICNPGGPC